MLLKTCTHEPTAHSVHVATQTAQQERRNSWQTFRQIEAIYVFWTRASPDRYS